VSSWPATRRFGRSPVIRAGSWIDASLATWVGDNEHNQAWDLLAETRGILAQQPDGPAIRAEARREVYIAEGSDWFWWFGRVTTRGMDVIWDNLYRLHLRHAISLLEQQRPPTHVQQSSGLGIRRRQAPGTDDQSHLDGTLDESE